MDDVDLANEHAEYFRRKALEAHFGRSGITLKSEQYPEKAVLLGNAEGNGPGPRSCIDCGHRIDPARLEAIPETVRCIDCQNKEERDHGLVQR